MNFQKPRILSNSEENTIRGKCLVNDHPTLRPSASEVMQLIGHLDLLVDKYREALETLSGCMPDKMYVYGASGDQWSADEPSTDEYEVVDFKELLGEE